MCHMEQDREVEGSTPAGDRDVHFEETLSISPGGLHPIYWVLALLGVGAVGVVPAYFGVVWIGIILLGVFAVAAYIAFGRRVHVRVTDEDVDVRLNWYGLDRSSGVEIPFAEIAGVEYTVPNGSHIRVKTGEGTGANRYMVPQKNQGTYRDGIRIGRNGADPVYVGTERPAELAETIVERTPGVENAEPFTVEGSQIE